MFKSLFEWLISNNPVPNWIWIMWLLGLACCFRIGWELGKQVLMIKAGK